MSNSKEILFFLEDQKGVLRLLVSETKVDDVRVALKVRCANALSQYDASEIELYATQDGKVKDGQKPLDAFAPISVIGEKEIVVAQPAPKRGA